MISLQSVGSEQKRNGSIFCQPFIHYAHDHICLMMPHHVRHSLTKHRNIIHNLTFCSASHAHNPNRIIRHVLWCFWKIASHERCTVLCLRHLQQSYYAREAINACRTRNRMASSWVMKNEEWWWYFCCSNCCCAGRRYELYLSFMCIFWCAHGLQFVDYGRSRRRLMCGA